MRFGLRFGLAAHTRHALPQVTTNIVAATFVEVHALNSADVLPLLRGAGGPGEGNRRDRHLAGEQRRKSAETAVT